MELAAGKTGDRDVIIYARLWTHTHIDSHMRAYTYSPTSACRCAVSDDQVGFQQVHLDAAEIDLLDEQVLFLCWRFVALCLHFYFLAILAARHEGTARSVCCCHFGPG